MINLKKSDYSENVVRKSLYWLTETCLWKLDDSSDFWCITLLIDKNDYSYSKAVLDRLLNDFTLREKLDISTQNLRTRIISAALKKLGNHEDHA